MKVFLGSRFRETGWSRMSRGNHDEYSAPEDCGPASFFRSRICRRCPDCHQEPKKMKCRRWRAAARIRTSMAETDVSDSGWSGHVQQAVARTYFAVLGSLQKAGAYRGL